jgi:hypothetical protein
MATRKPAAAKSAEAKVVAPEAEEKTTKVTTAPAEEKKKTVRKVTEKKEENPTAPTASKEPKESKAAVKAADPTVSLSIQFAGKSYAQEDLTNIAKDVWQYDLGRSPSDLQSVVLYVKPEESMVYYVFNDHELGSFQI